MTRAEALAIDLPCHPLCSPLLQFLHRMKLGHGRMVG